MTVHYVIPPKTEITWLRAATQTLFGGGWLWGMLHINRSIPGSSPPPSDEEDGQQGCQQQQYKHCAYGNPGNGSS